MTTNSLGRNNKDRLPMFAMSVYVMEIVDRRSARVLSIVAVARRYVRWDSALCIIYNQPIRAILPLKKYLFPWGLTHIRRKFVKKCFCRSLEWRPLLCNLEGASVSAEL